MYCMNFCVKLGVRNIVGLVKNVIKLGLVQYLICVYLIKVFFDYILILSLNGFEFDYVIFVLLINYQ